MKPIFVIVENITAQIADDVVFECICRSLGYYTDEQKIEAKVNALNKKWCRDRRNEGETLTEDDETRFSFVCLLNK